VIDDDLLVELLWDLFRPEIASGEPVRFCFSGDLLAEHFAKSGHDGSVPEWISSCARNCFDVGTNKVSLVVGAFCETKCGLSRAIVLVCQQVLAVEEMVAEGTQYSENAYFPRLRRLMASELPRVSANPFGFDEFESIWRTFAREVRRVRGSSDDTITFEFDAYEGNSKARQFPMSQALFSRGDLSSLATYCRQDRLRSASADDVWSEVRRERYHLTRRAQKIINSGFLRERLIDQTRRFAERLLTHEKRALRDEQLPLESLSLFISLDVVDGVREEYFAFLMSDDTGQRVDNAVEVEKRVDAVLGRRGYFFCALNQLSDGWTYASGERAVSPGDSIIVVGRKRSILEGKEHASRYIPSIEWDDSRTRSLGADETISVVPFALPMVLRNAIILRAGAIVEERALTQTPPTFKWMGGICLDSRSCKYLFPYLPTGVIFGERQFNLHELRRVSGTRMDWNAFGKSIAHLRTDVSYEIEFTDGFEARLAIASQCRNSDRMGFPFNSMGQPSPMLAPVGALDSAIVGFECPAQRIERPADTRTVARLLRDLKLRAGRAPNDKELQIARDRVETSSTPATVKRVINALLAKDPLISDDVLAELCK
jgi:hypothetical protein